MDVLECIKGKRSVRKFTDEKVSQADIEKLIVGKWMRSEQNGQPVLTDEKDWNDIRQRVRETTIEAETTQARLEYLRTQIIALQAEGIHPTKDAEGQEQQIIAEQLEELEQQRRNILQQIAHYDELLRAHEQACAATGTL